MAFVFQHNVTTNMHTLHWRCIKRLAKCISWWHIFKFVKWYWGKRTLSILYFVMEYKSKTCSLILIIKKEEEFWDETKMNLLNWTQDEINLHKSRKTTINAH
jgi:hypothetical protein